MDYTKDIIGRYLAARVIQNRADSETGITYEKAITSTRTTKEAIDYWLEVLGV